MLISNINKYQKNIVLLSLRTNELQWVVLSPQVFLFSLDNVAGRYYSMLYTLAKGIFFPIIFNFSTFRFRPQGYLPVPMLRANIS